MPSLTQQIVNKWMPYFHPESEILYISGSYDQPHLQKNESLLSLGIPITSRTDFPSVLVHDTKRNWLVAIVDSTSQKTIDQDRLHDLVTLFSQASTAVIYITAFTDRQAYAKQIPHIAWKTDVWIADAPKHLIHHNGSHGHAAPIK